MTCGWVSICQNNLLIILDHKYRYDSRVEKGMIDGRKREKTSYRLQGSEAIVVNPIQSQPSLLLNEPQDIPLSIVYEDDAILVIDKQPGLVIHPGTGVKDNTLVNGLMYYTRALSDINGSTRPGIIHRLDRDTLE
ncbi:MAG: hypothetical protein CM1200mP10_21220 [Candidatus Neomarinimicrobiota bacterium]|nr:MAG: hypothetical protein CM1200mP10_21220 [Candidatus Neomarinimicrobiota bacterium]